MNSVHLQVRRLLSSHRGRDAFLLAFASFGSALAVAASAATPADEQGSGGLEEVTISARFKTEDSQRAPLAVSTLTATDLQDRGIAQISDLTTSLPSVTFVPSSVAYGKAITAFVRGIGQTDSSPAFNPAVAFYIDDAYYGTVTGANLNLLDIASIDVLRGPQGTLFGANSESGAVQIHTVQPKGDNSGFASVSYGSFNHEKVTGGFDASLVDNVVFMRVSGFSEKQDGYQNVLDFACLYPAQSGLLKPVVSTASNCKIGTQGGTDTIGGRVALRWLASDTVDVNLSVDASHDTGGPLATTLIALNPGAFGLYNAHVVVPALGIPLDSRFIPSSPYISYATYTDPFNGLRFDPTEPLLQYGFAGTLNWKLSDDVNLKAVSNYRHVDGSDYVDHSQAPIPSTLINGFIDRHELSEEVLANGLAFNKSLEWTVGAYYDLADSSYSPLLDAASAPPAPLFIERVLTKDTNTSEFVHLLYHVTNEFSVEGGLRHTEQRKDVVLSQQALDPGALGFPAQLNTSSVSRFDPKVSLQYQWTPDFMTYATYSTGFKGGGVNPYVVLFLSEITPFGPETMKNYELGAKSEWLDHHVRVNAAVYQMDYDGLQEQIAQATTPFPQEVNVGSARIRGVELELNTKFGGFEANLAADYLKYQTLTCGNACIGAGHGGDVPLNGVAPYTPKFKFSLGAQYAINTGVGTLTPRVDYTYQDKVYFDASNEPQAMQDAYGVANVRLLWDSKSSWSGEIALTNATGKQYYLNEYNGLNNGIGTVVGTPAAPREVLVTLRKRF